LCALGIHAHIVRKIDFAGDGTTKGLLEEIPWDIVLAFTNIEHINFDNNNITGKHVATS
jgi:hypothetical protein